MNNEDFDKIKARRCDLILKVLAEKGEEYARKDAFSHLKGVADLSNMDVLRTAWVALSKHLVSVRTLTEDFASGNILNKPMRPVIQEKIGDAINYLIILEGLFEERLSGKP